MSGLPGPFVAVPALTNVLPPLSSVNTPAAPSSKTCASMVWVMPEPLMRNFTGNATVGFSIAGITVSRVVNVRMLPVSPRS